MTAPLVERAPAKVNLTLRVIARRDDGLHEIESLVVFAQVADELTLDMARPHGLDLRGVNLAACGPIDDNLVLKAARALAGRIPTLRLGHFTLDKRIPIAAGLGGGSSDAAAALRLLARANGLALEDARLLDAARATGADVPICLDPRPRMMRGVGEILSGSVELPPLAAVLVNPGEALATKDVFAAFDRQKLPASRKGSTGDPKPRNAAALFAILAEQGNDLESAAISLQPSIADGLAALRVLPQCRLARMSGSGATCFALWDSMQAAAAASQALRAARPGWWIQPTALGNG